MARACLLALGISACILGAECMALDHFVLYGDGTQAPAEEVSLFGPPASAPTRQYKPPEWMGWTFLSGGAIVILYSLAMKPE